MAWGCRILVVQRSSKYILISLDFLLSSKFIIVKESYASIIFLIISGSSPRRKFSKMFTHSLSSWLVFLDIQLNSDKVEPEHLNYLHTCVLQWVKLLFHQSVWARFKRDCKHGLAFRKLKRGFCWPRNQIVKLW